MKDPIKPISRAEFREKYGDKFQYVDKKPAPKKVRDETESMKGVKCHQCGTRRGRLIWIEGRTFICPKCQDEL